MVKKKSNEYALIKELDNMCIGDVLEATAPKMPYHIFMHRVPGGWNYIYQLSGHWPRVQFIPRERPLLVSRYC